jgi:hypothetical protein
MLANVGTRSDVDCTELYRTEAKGGTVAEATFEGSEQ